MLKEIAALLPLCVILLSGCSKDNTSATPAQPGAIAGTVRSSLSQTLIRGAVVTTLPITVTDTTDSGGLYLLPGIPAGNYLVIARAPDFVADSSNVLVSSGATVTHHISLVSTTGAITGRVTWEGPGTPIVGAVVRTIPSAGEDTADANGEYTLPDIPVGTYSVLTEAPDFVTDSLQVVVSSGITETFNISLNAVIPTQGLILYFPFNGNANDESGHNNNGVVSGATLTTDRDGQPNRAYAFDGINNHIDFPDIIRDTASAFTMSVWVRANGINTRRVALYTGANTGESSIEILNSNFSFLVNISNVNWFSASSPALAGQFVHLVGVYRRGDRLQLWVNGSLTSEAQVPLGTLVHGRPTHTSSVGSYAPQWLDWGRQNGINSWQGTVDQVRIYSRALTREEVLSLYYSGE